MAFNGIFKHKKVLITGHTGFKGSWLSTWLNIEQAKVYGISLNIPTEPSHFKAAGLESKLTHTFCDIKDAEKINALIGEIEPDFVFHLAAQPLVSISYEDPLDTINTNVLGTANILQALRFVKKKCAAVIITSDKAYENQEWIWGYRETDTLGGKDMYSASKGAAELIFHGFCSSFFQKKDVLCRVASARAGNVIGGGDWAKDRIVADAMRAWSSQKAVRIRSPRATRPWQHVLEPLSGYLSLAEQLYTSEELHGESFNFGPRDSQNQTVYQLLAALSKRWGYGKSEEAIDIVEDNLFHEASLLKLNCDKALFHLKWQSTLNFDETVEYVGDWYKNYYQNGAFDIAEYTTMQIHNYISKANILGLDWIK